MVAQSNAEFQDNWAELLSHKQAEKDALQDLNRMLQRKGVRGKLSHVLREEWPLLWNVTVENISMMCSDSDIFKEAWDKLVFECGRSEKKVKNKL